MFVYNLATNKERTTTTAHGEFKILPPSAVNERKDYFVFILSSRGISLWYIGGELLLIFMHINDINFEPKIFVEIFPF